MKNPNSKKIECAGLIWTKPDYPADAEWIATIDDKFIATTWQFGSWHQAKVFVKYPHTIDGKPFQSHFVPPYTEHVGISCAGGTTLEKAMQTMAEWVNSYQKNGPGTVEQMFALMKHHVSDMFPTHEAMIDHLFFVCGGGYEWLDGALHTHNIDEYEELEKINEHHSKKMEEMSRMMADHNKLFDELRAKYPDLLPEIEREEDLDSLDAANLKRWQGDKFQFYPVGDYANILEIPDDIKPDWLALAYEAAVLLRDKSGVPDHFESKWIHKSEDDHKTQKRNSKMGAKIVKELERRFPHVKQKGQQVPSQTTG